MPRRYTLDELVAMIDEPNGGLCRIIMRENHELFRQAAGSTHNHQAWVGGYWDHITEVMNNWMLLYGAFASTGRLDQLRLEERFTCSDGLLVLFLHDIEKPWSYTFEDGLLVTDEQGRPVRSAAMADKQARKLLAEQKIRSYGIVLNPLLCNALQYVEGIRDGEYSQFDRRMLPLAALCHACDMLSARAFYEFPLAVGDAWDGARRIAFTQ